MPPIPTPPSPRGLAARTVRVRFLNGACQEFRLGELGLILRHPVVIFYLTGSMVITLAISIALILPDAVQHALLAPILAIATGVGVLFFIGWVCVLALLVPGPAPVPLFISAPMAVCAFLVQGVAMLLGNLLLHIPPVSTGTALLAVVLIFVLDEAALNYFFVPRVARVIDDVRRFRDPSARPPRPETPAPALPAGPQVIAGSSRLDAAAILHLRAQGNNVLVHTDSGHLQVPGPFSGLVAQLPETLGCLVHRSEWVATRAVASARRDGRATELVLTTGETVRVAATRAGHVRDWLAKVSAPPPRRRAAAPADHSTGGGDTNRQSRPAPDSTTSAMGGTAPSTPKAPDTPTKS